MEDLRFELYFNSVDWISCTWTTDTCLKLFITCTIDVATEIVQQVTTLFFSAEVFPLVFGVK